jgi:hypothetical protein
MSDDNRMIAYGHELLTDEQQQSFIFSSSGACPVCGEFMTQQENPTGGDSWWFTCPNKHAAWIGK